MKRLSLALLLVVLGVWPVWAQQPAQVIGPITPGDLPVFNSTTVIKDSGIPASGAGSFVLGPATSVVGDVAVWNNLTGTLLKDTPPLQIFGTQSANTVLAGPTTGAAANPTFRLLVGADLPPLVSANLDGICSTNNDILIRLSGTWQCGATGTSGHVVSFLDGANVSSGANAFTSTVNIGTNVSPASGVSLTVNKNAVAPPTPVTGAIAQFVAADTVSTTAEIDALASFPILQLSRADGTGAAPSAIQSGDIFGIISGRGYGATGYSAGAAQIRLLAAQTFTDAAQGSRVSILTTPNGSPANGNIREVARFDQDRSSVLFGPTVLTANGITSYSCDLVCALLTVNNNAAAAPTWANAVGEQWAIQVAGKDGQATVIGIDSFGTGNEAAFSIFDFRRTNGTAASPSALKSGDLIGVLGAIGYAATGYSSGTAQYRVFTTQDWTDTAQGSRVEILTTANGVPAFGNARAVIRLDQDRTTLLFGKAVIGGQLLASGGSSTPLVDLNGSAAATNFVGGSNAPMLRLLAADGNATNQSFQNYGSQNQFSAFEAANTAASPTALTGAGTVIFNFNGFAYDGTGWFNTGSSSNVAIQLQIAETQTTSAHGTQIAFLTTPTGTIAKATAATIQASGGVAIGTTADPGLGGLIASGHIQLGNSTAATLSAGELDFAKITASATAPTAGNLKIAAVAGTNAGTCKLIAYAGTSNTPVTIIDNVGAGC